MSRTIYTSFLMLSFVLSSAFSETPNRGCENQVGFDNLINCILEGRSHEDFLSRADVDRTCDDVLQAERDSFDSRKLTGLTPRFFADGADCRAFVRDDGSLGDYGQIIRNYILSSDEKKAIFLNDNIPEMSHGAEVCPRWTKMSKEERLHFWAWTFAAIAWDETRCVPNRRNVNATDGVAIGLLQLNEDLQSRRWRGPNCRGASVANPSSNLLCGLDIMSELMKGRQGVYRSSGAIFSSQSRQVNSYWEKLRGPGGGTIGARIIEHPSCR